MSVFVICVEAVIYLLLYNLHGCTFKDLSPLTNFEKNDDARLGSKNVSEQCKPIDWFLFDTNFY